MKSITKRIISTLAICGALVLEAGATAIGSLGKALNNIAKVDAADTTATIDLADLKWGSSSQNAFGESNAQAIDTNTCFYFGGGGNAGKYYTTSPAGARMYQSASDTITVKALNSVKLTSVTFTYNVKSNATLHSSSGTSISSPVYTSGTKVTLSNVDSVTAYTGNTTTTTNGQVAISAISVTYSGGTTPTTTYSVNYLANTTDAVTGMPSSETGLSAGSHTLSTAKPTRNGYDFVGWNTDSTATTGITSVTITNANVDVYAIWKEQGGSGGTIVTDYTKIVSNTKYLIRAKCGENPVDYFVANGGTAVGTGLSRNNIGTKDEATPVLFKGSGSNWTLQFDNGNYLYLRSSESNGYYSVSDSKQEWTASNSSSLIKLTINSKSLARNSNYATKYFGSYSSGTYVSLEECAPEKTVTSITVKTAPSKVTYFEGESFDPTGLVITATYDDTSTADIAYADSPSDFSFSPTGSLATTDNNIVITYKEKTANQTISVNSDVLNSITLGGSVSFNGTAWDLSGVTLTGHYVSGDRAITSFTPTTTTSVPTKGGTYDVSVSVSFGGKSDSKNYSVTIAKGTLQTDPLSVAEAIAISATHTNANVTDLYYVEGDVTVAPSTDSEKKYGNLHIGDSSNDLYVYGCTSSDGSLTKNGTYWSFTNPQDYSKNDLTKNIAVGDHVLLKLRLYAYTKSGSTTYEGDGQVISVSQVTVSSIAVTTNPTNSQYSGKAFDKTGMVVTATYSDESTANVTNSVVIEPATLASNTTSVIIKYTEGENTVQTSLTIDALTLSKITVENQTTEFRAGDTFAFDGDVYPWYTHSNGNPESKGSALASTEYTVSKSGALSRGNDQEVVITHTASSKTCSYTIDVDYAYVTSISMDTSIELGLGGEATFAATVSPELADQSVTYSIDTEETTLQSGEYTLTGNKLEIADDIAASGDVYVIATTVGKDSDGQSKTTSCKVSVTKAIIAQITAVTVSGAVSATEQYVGKDFNYAGLTFTPVWSEGEHETVTITGADIVWPALTNGMTSIKGQYDTGSSKLDVDVSGFTVVEDYLKSIAVAGDMTNKTYYSNADEWNFAGLSVTGKNASGDDATIVQANVEYTANLTPAEYLSTSAEKLVVTATYGEKTDTIDITGIVVNEYKLNKIEVTTNPSKVEYIIGETFSEAGLVVKATYSDGTIVDNFEGYTLDKSAINMYAAGTYTVKVQASGVADASFDVKYGVITPQEGFEYWQKVTSNQTDMSGEYLLAYQDTTNTLFWTGVDAGKCHVDIATPSTGKLDSKPTAAISIIVEKMDGGYSIKVNGGTNNGKYLGRSEYNNGMEFSDSKLLNTISIDDSGNAVICGSGNSGETYVQMKYNKNSGDSNERFRYYKSGQQNVILYKLYKQEAVVADLIKLNVLCTKTFKEGETLNISDLTVNGLYNDGNSKAITTGVTFSDGSSSKVLAPGDNNLTVKYGELTENITISATPLLKYDLSVTINNDQAEYTVSPALTDGKLIGGEDYTIEVSAKEGYVIESVTAPGATVSGNTVTITDASSDVSITVSSRALAMFGITDSTDEYVTLVNTATQVKEGTTYESDVTFATGKELDTVSVTMGGVEVTGAYSNGHIKVENVSGDLIISITSKDVYFDVEYNFNHVSGVAISPETSLPEKVVYNGSVSFKVEPESGYAVDTGHIMVKEDGAAKTFSYDSTTGILTVSNVTNALEIAIDAFKLAEVTKDLGDGLSISHESSPVSINNSYTLELSLADGKEITSVSVKMGGEPVDDAWNASTLTVYIATVTDDIEIKIETKTIQVPINANGNITVDPEVKDYGSESVTVTVSPKEGYVITENSLYYTIGDDDTHHTITGNSFVIDSLTEEINVYGETIAVYNLSYDLTDLTHSEADPYIEKDLDTFEIVLEVDGDKSVYGIDMTTFKVEMGGEDITGDITKVVYTHDKANGKLTINLVVSELTGDIKVTAARGSRLFDVSVTGQTDLVDVTGDLEIAYDSTGSITFTPADHYHFEANGIQVVNSGSAEVLLDSQPDGSVILHFLTGVKGDVSITVAVVHDLVSVTTGTLEHITFDFTTVEHENIEYGTAVTGHFTAEFGYERPISITVTCYGELLEKTDYAYNQATGVFSIYAMGDIVISAKGTQGQVEVVATGDEHVSFNDGEGLPAITDSGLPFIATVEAEEGYKISSIVVTMNGSEVPNAYNEATGTITIQSVNDKINIAVTTVKLHSVEYDIENVTISDHIYEVVDNGTYTLIMLVNDGYELKNGAVSVTMGGEDVTADVLGEGVIFISQVTGDVQVSIKATKKLFSVTNTLTNASNSNAATTIEYGASYQAVISAVTGYENLTCTVKMGGVDVPCVNGVIIISKVTGAIEITASAVASKVNVSVDVTNVTCTIDSQQVDYNSSLEFKLTQDDNTFDYVYSVTMGGEPVDGLNGVYTIEHVTGEIVIEASATIIELESITASLEYPYNLIDYDSDFPMEWLEVIAHYNNGDSQEVTSGITIEGFERTVSGEQTITVKALGLETTVDVEVLESTIVVNVSANTVEESYDFGYEFTKFDVDVYIEMSDGITYVMMPDDISGYDITKSGEQSITVYCGEYELQITVKINASTEIESISAVANKDNLTYGDSFNASDVTVTAKYTDGLTEEISAEYVEFLGAPGKNIVVVHAAGKTCTVEVTVKPSEVIDHIDALPNDISYAYGYELKASDFAVTATYTDGHIGTVDATSVVAEDLVPGLNVVVVKVGELSCNVVVKVDDSTEIASISAVIKDGKDTVAYEGAFTADDVTVYATYTDGKTKVVTGFTMSGFDNKHIGVNTVTITLDGKTCTVKVTVLASTVVDHIEAVATKDNLTYGDTFTKDDVKVTEVYTDGHKVENLAADSISGFTGKVGVNNVTVVYGGKEASIQVTVKASEVIDSIEAVVNEGKAELEYGAAFTKDDVTVTATYTDGHTAVVAADSVDFAGTVGENTVVVHVGDKTCEVKVTVKASEVITGIEVSTEKTNVEYGGTFTKDDVKAHYVYSDGHKVDATVDSISGFSATTLGKQVITVKVGEYSATLEITVSGRVALSIEVIGYNDTVDQGKDYVFTGKVIAHYNDGTTEEVTAYTMEAVDTSKAGKKTVKVSFENVSATFDINVIQTKTEIEPTYMTAIIGGSVVGVAILAVGIFLFLKSFKL